MAIKYYNSEEEMDDAFDELEEINQHHEHLKTILIEAEEYVEEKEYDLEIAAQDVLQAKNNLIEAQRELDNYADIHKDDLF